MVEVQGKRELIKTVATRMFAERGVAEVSVRDIAQACDMRAPNLYAHFVSKESLVAEIFTQGYADYGKQIAECMKDCSFPQALERMIRLVCSLHDHDNARFRFLLMTQHYHLKDIEREAENNPVAVICSSVLLAMDQGWIEQDNSELIASSLVGIVVQAATFRLYGRIRENLEPLADDLVATALRIVRIKAFKTLA